MNKNQIGKNLSYVRHFNQGLVLKKLLIHGPSSRNELSMSLGLTKMTITNIVTDLLDHNIVSEEICNPVGSACRKIGIISLNSDVLYAIGVHVSHSNVCCSIADITGNLLERCETILNAKTTRQTLTSTITTHIQYFLQKYNDRLIVGIGVASIGLVDSKHGSVLSSTNFYDISDWNIGQELTAKFSLPVYVTNDMKAAALAEYYYGSKRRFSSFVYMGISNGIGAGIIANDELFEGGDGYNGSVGHMSINRDGPLCPCGNKGCLELYTSVPSALNISGCKTWKDFLQLFEAVELPPVAERFLDDLSIGLTSLVNIFNPEAIFIGHSGAYLNNYCFERLRISVNASSLIRSVHKVEVLPSSLSERISYLSAIAPIFSRLLSGEISLPQ
mgnify:FL=1